jgi:hypothetical protein
LALAGKRQSSYAQRFSCAYKSVGLFLQQYPSADAPDIWTFADGFAKLSRQELDLEKPG